MAINEENIKSLKDEISLVEESLVSIGSAISDDINLYLVAMDDATKKVAKSFQKDLGNAITSVSKSASSQEKIIQKINKGQDASKDISSQISKIEDQKRTILRKVGQLKRNNVDFDEEALFNLTQELDSSVAILKILQEQNDEMQDQLGLAGELIGGFAGVLTKLGMGAKTTQLVTKGLAQAKVEGSGITGAVTNIVKNLKAAITPTDILLLTFGKILEATFKIDKLTGETAKNLGISYKESLQLTSEMSKFARESGDVALNTERMLKAQNELNKAFRTSTTLSTELTADFVKLTEQAGYAPEAMTKLAKITQSTGGDLSNNTAEMLGTVKALNTVNGLALNEKTLIEDIANTSAATVLTLGRQGKALAQNVFQARQFGITMDQAAGISDSLLNFQSSIENELEAELLTGKELNLEQARFLALQGKTGEAAAEVLKQVGSAAEFGNMSVLAQEALAKAMGMEREALAASLIEREALANIGATDLEGARAKYDELVKTYGQEEAIKRLGDEKLAQQFASQSAQEKLNNVTQKFQELFIQIGEPLANIISQVADLLIPAVEGVLFVVTPILDAFKGMFDIIGAIFDPTTSLKDTLGEMGPLVAGMATAFTIIGTALTASILPGLIKSVVSAGALALEMGIAAVASISTASAMTLGIGIVAVIAGITAAVMAMNNAKQQVGDMISPADGKTQISTKEGGLLELSDNDDVVAAPGAAKALKNRGRKSSPTIDIAPLVEQMNNMNATLNAILNKEGIVMLDSTKVGTALNMGSYKLQ